MVLHILQLIAVAANLGYAVTVADTLRYPDGTLVNGNLVIELTTGTNTSSITYAGFRKVVPVTSGVMSVDLAANTSLQPSGTYYRVTYRTNQLGGTASIEYWNVPTGGPYTVRDVRWKDRSPTGYVTSMSGTSWVVPASVHGIRTRNMTVRCEDASGNLIECAPTINNLWTVRVTYPVAQTGRLILNAVSAWSAQNYQKSITSVTTSTIPYSEHGLGTNRIEVQCWDNAEPSANVECASTVHPSTYTVTVTFAVAQSGYIVLSGR